MINIYKVFIVILIYEGVGGGGMTVQDAVNQMFEDASEQLFVRSYVNLRA